MSVRHFMKRLVDETSGKAQDFVDIGFDFLESVNKVGKSAFRTSVKEFENTVKKALK